LVSMKRRGFWCVAKSNPTTSHIRNRLANSPPWPTSVSGLSVSRACGLDI
jgi:hypothetical protein